MNMHVSAWVLRLNNDYQEHLLSEPDSVDSVLIKRTSAIRLNVFCPYHNNNIIIIYYKIIRLITIFRRTYIINICMYTCSCATV